MSVVTEREKQLLFALQSAWPYVHQWCTISSVRNEVTKALFGREIPRGGKACHPIRDGYTGSVLTSDGEGHTLHIHYATREQADAAQLTLTGGA